MATEKIMERVARLLAIAEHPNTPSAEAEVALAQANSLITKHAIDEAVLRMQQTEEERRAPSKASIHHGWTTWSYMYTGLLSAMGAAFRVSVAHTNGAENTDLYGAAEDVAWVEMLFASTKLTFLSKIDPSWDESLGYDANVYAFKVAGFKWVDIDLKAQANGHATRESTERYEGARYEADYNSRLIPTDEVVWEHPHGITSSDRIVYRRYNGFYHKLKAAYLRHAKKIGDQQQVRTQSHQAYRLGFVDGFMQTMRTRLRQLAQASADQADTIPGAALALSSMAEEARRMMWDEHPELDPETIAAEREARRQMWERQAREREEMLAAMSPKERAEFLAKEEKEEERARRRNEKHLRYYTIDDSARARGHRVASTVDLGRKAGYAEPAQERPALGG